MPARRIFFFLLVVGAVSLVEVLASNVN
jgi:hypothetical protein